MKRSTILFLIMLVPNLIFVHGIHGSGFVVGFTHPFLGIDNLVTILGVSTLSTLKLEKRWHILPLAFILLIAIIGIIGIVGIGNEANI